MEQLSVLEAATVPTEPGSAPAPVEAWSAGRRERSEVITSSLAFGFPWADISHVGMAFVVCTDNDQPAAQRIADDLAAQAWQRREYGAHFLGLRARTNARLSPGTSGSSSARC